LPDGAALNGHEGLLKRLRAAVGDHSVLIGSTAEPFYTDVYRRLETPIAVIRPATVDALQATVREASTEGVAMFPRGGGASYTDGYLPSRPDCLVIDTGGLDRIVEINETDAYVTVEAGVTWAKLKAALDPLGLRTPFFGPFSGFAATVGGSMSQNALSHGSGAHGVSAQSVLSMDVVIASGELIRTGSAARGSPPFARFYGPDLAGLFTGDCGALGIKARITLPLLRQKPAFQAASFGFSTLPDLAAAMRRAALERLDDEHFAIDAALSQGQIARQGNAGAMMGMARSVLASSPSLTSGLARLVKMALAGTRAIQDAAFMLHVILDGVSDGEVKAKLHRLRDLMAPGREIPNTVPTVVRGMHFAPLLNTLGPKGERWVPLHGVLPHSQVAPFHDALEALYAVRADEMKRLGVWRGAMFETVGSTGLLYEVALYWPGPPTAYHQAVLPADYLSGLPSYADDAEVNAFVHQLKADITALYAQYDAVHFQLGKTYPYAGVLQPEPLALLRAVKAAVDPEGLMNPGALGL
jgi:glycolate oxidase